MDAYGEIEVSTIEQERLARQQCPHCGTDLEVGFGLAGGGYGAYLYCPAEECGKYFDKMQERDSE
jgi:hypothetical protein